VLRWRLISAAVIVSSLLALVWLDYRQGMKGTPGVWLMPVLLLVSTVATEELLSLLRNKGHESVSWIVYVGNFVIPFAAAWPVVALLLGWKHAPWPLASLAVLAIATILVLLGEMARFERSGSAVVNGALSTFALVYVGFLISFWPLLRLHRSNEWGILALVSMLLIVKMADTGAFACGRVLGRHKMTPILSPGKTWEGTMGGIITACATSWLFFRFAAPRIVPGEYVQPTLAAVLAYGALLAIAGIIGDLAESLIKRDMGRKDSSTWLRGLGGVLDIIDAPLVAGPVAWLCWTLGLLGP
jgi:phosphatidate cytidylyltransferase